jgi:7-carboxy-7-deazaguanine synthase (Cx14CxxC type)
MTYSIKEIFYTLQGEGANTGRAAVFCRFTGCNLWSGRERDRAEASCRFCDTDFLGIDGPGGGRFETALRLAAAIARVWDEGAMGGGRPLVVCTGGEPLLQLDSDLVGALHAAGFEVAVETNGTRPAPEDIDWLCVSPKGSTRLLLQSGNELKLVYPQADAPPERFENLAFEHFFLQPLDGPQSQAHTLEAVCYCLTHPRWRLSLQTHKLLGIR